MKRGKKRITKALIFWRSNGIESVQEIGFIFGWVLPFCENLEYIVSRSVQPLRAALDPLFKFNPLSGFLMYFKS